MRENSCRPYWTRSNFPHFYPALPCRAFTCCPLRPRSGQALRGLVLPTSFHLFTRNSVLAHTLNGPTFSATVSAGRRTKLVLAFCLLILISSTIIVGYGNHVGGCSH